MQTYLGITQTYSYEQLDLEKLKQSEMIYVEGYLVASDSALEACKVAMTEAKNNGVKIALTLSDPSMPTYFRDAVNSLIDFGVDVLFGNEEEIKMINESRQKVAKQLTEKDAEIEEHKKTIESLGHQLREKDDNAERVLGENAEVIENLEASIEYLQEQVKEKDKEIGQKTMDLRQHRWRSNKMIYELKDELEEKDKELEEIKPASHLKEDSSPDEESAEDSEEEDVEEEPRRRYVAPTVDDPFVPVMENGIKKWYRRSKCCGSHTWTGEELWVRNWM